jgi:chromosome segregation protein
MTAIKRISMTGFKSFGNRNVTVKLASGFTCIVGPNGSGKSNVIDGICFCLGRLSKKTMRAKSLTDLIFSGTSKIKPGNHAEVTMVFDNTNHEFPTDAEEFAISRSIKRNGQGAYKVQGKSATRTDILNALATANIDPEGYNFVLQGKIVELTHMDSDARRKFIESLIGLEKYDEMKDATLKELEKADKDLGKFEAIFSEIAKQLRAVEKERNDALKWKELDTLARQASAQLIALRISKLRTEETQLESSIEESQLAIEDLMTRIESVKGEIEAKNFEMKTLEEEITGKDEQRQKANEGLTQAKQKHSSKETELKIAKDNLEKLDQRKTKLEGLQPQLKEGETFDGLVANVNRELEQIKGKIDATTKEIDDCGVGAKEREDKVKEVTKEKTGVTKQINTKDKKVSSLNAENGLLQKQMAKLEKDKIDQNSELQKLKGEAESTEDAMAAVQKEMDGFNGEIEEFKQNIAMEQEAQRKHEEKISTAESSRGKVDEKLSDLKAHTSSLTQAIIMYEDRIKRLKEEQKELHAQYERIKGDKSMEEAVKTVREREKTVKAELTRLKKQYDELTITQRKAASTQEGIESQRGSLEKQSSDYRARIASIDSELKLITKDVTTTDRDIKSEEVKVRCREGALGGPPKAAGNYASNYCPGSSRSRGNEDGN